MLRVGQLIVAIKNDPRGSFKKDEIFTVKAIQPAKCNCFEIIMDIGITSFSNYPICLGCNKPQMDSANSSTVYWVSDSLFIPVNYSFAKNILSRVEEEIDESERVKIKRNMFQVGQLVVSIHKNSSGHFKKGEIFTIKEVRKASCDCMECIVDIGKESLDEMQVCEDCNTKFFDTSTALWFSNRYFAPADTSFARNILWHIANEIENEYWKNNL